MKAATKIKHIKRLSALVYKYANSWGENPSNRMLNWVDDLGDLMEDVKRNHRAEWNAYCQENNLHPQHNQYDCMA